MAHREFRDSIGRLWAAWSVQPEYAERRASASSTATATAPADPPKVERRGRTELRVPLSGNFSHGWLCFETKGEKRRLAPFPDGWSELSDEDLEALCATAARVEHSSRRLVE